MISCPKCGGDIDVEEDELDEGDNLTCDECAANLVVTGVDPLELESEDDLDEDDEDLDDFDEEDEEGEEDEEEEEDEDWR